MRVENKKTMCNNCQKLVTGRAQSSEDTVKIICPSCNEVIWYWNGINWHQNRKQLITK